MKNESRLIRIPSAARRNNADYKWNIKHDITVPQDCLGYVVPDSGLYLLYTNLIQEEAYEKYGARRTRAVLVKMKIQRLTSGKNPVFTIGKDSNRMVALRFNAPKRIQNHFPKRAKC